MIHSFDQMYEQISRHKPVKLTVINPRQRDILEALEEAEKRGWIIPDVKISDDPVEAAQRSVMAAREGQTDLLMKGDVDTAAVLKAVLNSDFGIKTKRRLSHVAVVESYNYDRLMLMTDGGVNPDQSPEILESIIKNAVELAHRLGNPRPNIAMLSLIEKVNYKVPETVIARDMVQKFSEQSDFIIEGPIALDVCSSQRAADSKKIDSQISGKTDIFVGPNITTINFMVKALINLGGAKGGGIILGARVPIVLLSRSDTMSAKLNSIAIGIITLKGTD